MNEMNKKKEGKNVYIYTACINYMWIKDLGGLAKADLTLSSPNECLSD